MTRTAFITIFLLLSLVGFSQQGFFVLRKKNKTLQRFSTGSYITFQTGDGEWINGDIIKLQRDTFYVRPQSIRYTLFGADTVHYGSFPVAISDITLMPRPTAIIYFRDGRPRVIHGHEKFAYVRNGLLFQLAGAGYAGLNITNSLLDNKPPFGSANRGRLVAAAIIFGIGEALHLAYHQHLRIGRKYQLEYISL